MVAGDRRETTGKLASDYVSWIADFMSGGRLFAADYYFGIFSAF